MIDLLWWNTILTGNDPQNLLLLAMAFFPDTLTSIINVQWEESGLAVEFLEGET